MGWPRRRRAQQQHIRRQLSKESLALALKEHTTSGFLASASSTDLPLKPQQLQQLERSVSKWFDAASPRKAAASGLHHHRGLREKFYSVDSYAETEPEDDDDDEEEETESEGSWSGTPHCQHQHQHHQHALLKPEPVIPEEKESEPEVAVPPTPKTLLPQPSDELNEATDDEEDGYSSSDSKPPTPLPAPVSPVVTETVSEEAPVATELPQQETTAIQDETPVYASSVQFEASGVVVDGEDTECEDDAVLESSTVSIEEFVGSDFVAAKSPIVELEEVPSASDLSEPGAVSSEPAPHAPFLFPPPYFPGDLDEYESDIYETLLRREKTHHATADYFSFQPHVTHVMRAMLVDWLVEVHNHFNLQLDTLYLTVNYIDRFLSVVPVKRENFQLVALTALLIASKFEEVHPVDIEDLVYICERSYTAQQIVQFEKQMLAALQFNLVVPSCSGFLEYYVDKLSLPPVVGQLANFFSEQALLDFHLSAKYVPSVVASSAVLLAQCYAERAKPELAWVLEFEETTGYYAKDVWCCVRELSDMLASLSFDLVAVRTKFRSSRFGRVSDLPHLNVSAMVIE